MNLAKSSESLLDLAKSRQPADRERLLLAIADLCDAPSDSEAMLSPGIQTLLSSIFMSLVVEAERDIRHRLSQKLATAAWAPSALVNVLALDDIEIARPIIAHSPVLKELDLIRLLVEATIEHQIELARRPNLPSSVVSAILEKAEPAVLTALAGNYDAKLSPMDMQELVEASRQITAMRRPLSQHPRLTDQLAKHLYLLVGEALRQGLAERFQLETTALDAALSAAVSEAQDGLGEETSASVVSQGERDQMDRRLVDKLLDGGQLRPAYLIRALREGRLSLFVISMAALGDFEIDQIQATIDSDRPELLALACAAVSIDRSVFPHILGMVRGLNEARPGGGAEGARKASVAFAPVTPEVAAVAFREGVKALTAARDPTPV